MGKELIKKLLREALNEKVIQMHPNKPESKHDSDEEESGESYADLSAKEKRKVNTLTAIIRNATQGDDKILKLSQVGQAAGVIDAKKATDRSKLGKEVSGEPDADGNVRHLKPKVASRLVKVVNNPTAYLSSAAE